MVMLNLWSSHFRYIPADPDQKVTTFNLPGVNINVSLLLLYFWPPGGGRYQYLISSLISFPFNSLHTAAFYALGWLVSEYMKYFLLAWNTTAYCVKRTSVDAAWNKRDCFKSRNLPYKPASRYFEIQKHV